MTAGATWRWRRAASAFRPDDGWSLTTYIVGAGGSLTLTGEADGDGWIVTAAIAETTPLTPGRYQLRERFTRSVDGDAVAYDGISRSVAVLPNPETATAADYESHAERALALIEAKIEGRVVSDSEAHQILGRSLTRIPMEQLLKLQAHYRALVSQERAGASGGFRRVAVHFNHPSGRSRG